MADPYSDAENLVSSEMRLTWSPVPAVVYFSLGLGTFSHLQVQSDIMRSGQQNNNSNNNNNKNRSRGRNNNGGRKHVNPLSRNFESNGPDVKVRGNAAHIAEKYVQLARDAHASGDSVMAENYFQHAEHYFRIVSAAQPQGAQRFDQFGQEIDGEGDENEDGGNNNGDGLEQHARMPEPRQQERQQDRGERQNRSESQPRENQDAQAVATGQASGGSNDEAATADAGAPEKSGETEPRKVRERRPRRRRVAAGAVEAGAGVTGAADTSGPQPEVGELPAFITAGGPNAD